MIFISLGEINRKLFGGGVSKDVLFVELNFTMAVLTKKG
jgi:hypothetical protein